MSDREAICPACGRKSAREKDVGGDIILCDLCLFVAKSEHWNHLSRQRQLLNRLSSCFVCGCKVFSPDASHCHDCIPDGEEDDFDLDKEFEELLK